MKYLLGTIILQYPSTTPPSNDIEYWINYSLYNDLKINIWYISADINVGSYEKFLLPLGKISNT